MDIIIHGHLIDNTSGAINLLLNLILCICIVHVNSFVIVTGYFQCDQSFSLKKFLKIFNLQWFYKIIIVITLSTFGIISVSNIEFIREILPIGSTHNYWFINCYLVLYLISPFLNKFIKAMNQQEYRKCLLLNFFLFSIIAYITNNANNFLYFETLSLKNSIINKVSATTMGIYLIHDNMYIRTWIYKFLKIDIGSYIISKKYLIYLFIVAIIIFCCCSIIEALEIKWLVS